MQFQTADMLQVPIQEPVNFINDINQLSLKPVKKVGILASEVKKQEVEWLWQNRLAMGKFQMLVGEEGVGKSYLTAMVAAHVTTGKQWPDGSPCPMGGIVIVAPEDGAEDTILPRLIDAGADLSKVLILVNAIDKSASMRGSGETKFNFPDHIDTLIEAVRYVHAKLIIIDTLEMASKISLRRDEIIDTLINPCLKISSGLGPCILGINHFKPGKWNDKNIKSRVNGNPALNRTARITIAALPDMSNPGIVVLKDIKRNIGEEPEPFCYRLVETQDKRKYVEMVASGNMSYDENIELYRLSMLKQQILLYMKMKNKPVAPLEVAQDLLINHNTVKPYMKGLYEEGFIIHSGYGLYELPQQPTTEEQN